MIIPVSDISAMLANAMWPFLRIGALVMTAPVFSVALVPMRFRIALTLALTVVLVPVIPASPNVPALSGQALVIAFQQLMIGVVMGLAVQLVFDAVVLGGQAIAMSMGLGFATMIDPLRGVNVPVLSQFLLTFGTLVFLALDGHLLLIEALAASFTTLPVGVNGVSREGLWALLLWSSHLFSGALRIALPALVALLMVNLSFGVMSRAAPTLNLFAVGFPISMTLGFVIVLFGLPDLVGAMQSLTASAFDLIEVVVNVS
ncbi:MAG: flagellar biosynthetic protein FliR, partial [Pseudomonadota bacterium]